MAQPLWFRMWSEAKNDAKLDALTDSEFRCWFKLICAASEDDERGGVDIDDPELLALELRVDQDVLVRAIDRIERLRLVRCDGARIVFPSWIDRQYEKPSDRPEAVRERVRKHRQKAREEECNAPVTPLYRGAVTLTEQNRAEQSRADARGDSAPKCFEPVDNLRLLEAFGKFTDDSDFPAFLSAIASRCPAGCNGLHRCGVEFGIDCIHRARTPRGAVKFASEDGRS